MKNSTKIISMIIFMFVMVAVICIPVSISNHSNSNKNEGKVEIPDSAASLEGENYQDVIEKFEKNGFENIKTKKIDDLVTGWVTKEGEVESVSVDNDKSFGSDEWYFPDVPVVISYHVFPEESEDEDSKNEDSKNRKQKEKKDSVSAINPEDIEGKDVVEASQVLKNLNYKVTLLHDQSKMDLTGEIESYDENTKKEFVVVKLGDVNEKDKEVTLYIDSLTNIAEKKKKAGMEKTLTDKLDPYYAWTAAQEYGKEQYPYGFKLHYIMGKLAQEPVDENIWFLKATCTVENAYGNKIDMNCEAQVTGTTNNPVVVDFKVY